MKLYLLPCLLLAGAVLAPLTQVNAQPADAPPPRERDQAAAEKREFQPDLRPGGPSAEAREMERRHLKEQLADLQLKHKTLVESGRMDDAAKVKDHMANLERHLAELRRADAELKRAEAERDEQAERMQNMKRKLRELRDQGRQEEAARLERELRGQPQLEGPPAELERRLHHLRVAIENLHAGGFHEPAERLERAAEQLRQRLGRQPHGPGREFGPDRSRPPFEELAAQLEEVRQNLRKLQEQVERLSRPR